MVMEYKGTPTNSSWVMNDGDMGFRINLDPVALNLSIDMVLDHPDAVEPTYEKHGDSGCSMRVVEDYVIKPGQRILASTGVKMAIPLNFEGQLRPRSGNAWKKGLSIVNTPGTIDSNYRGEIKVALINLGQEDIVIQKGDAVAQMVFCPVYKGMFNEVETLDSTDRGEGGFGSTGR